MLTISDVAKKQYIGLLHILELIKHHVYNTTDHLIVLFFISIEVCTKYLTYLYI